MARTEEWSKEKLKAGFDAFIAEYGHAPTATEIDMYSGLPSARQLQRKFPGGLPALRVELGVMGPTDYTKGRTSSVRAHDIALEAKYAQRELVGPLVDHFGFENVRPQFGFTDDRRTRVDFYLIGKREAFSVDMIVPRDLRALANCLNRKQKIFRQPELADKPVIFVVMNDVISDRDIDELLAGKVKPLGKYQRVMTKGTFLKHVAQVAPRNGRS